MHEKNNSWMHNLRIHDRSENIPEGVPCRRLKSGDMSVGVAVWQKIGMWRRSVVKKLERVIREMRGRISPTGNTAVIGNFGCVMTFV